MTIVEPSAVYAMLGIAPIRHVVTKLGGTTDPLPLSELARSYNHSVPGDLARVRLHEKCSDDGEAKEWMIRHAISELGPEQVEEIDGGYRLKKPIDKIRYRKKRVQPIIEETHPWHGISDALARFVSAQERADGFKPAQGIRPFSEVSGIFYQNIRAREHDDDTELRESMRELGWVKQFPALRDENGVVLTGHRRLKIAAELGLEPVYEDIKLGRGDAADAERLKIALASNIGFKPMSAASRRRIAAYLIGELHWTFEKVGQALRVSKMTISRDISEAGGVVTSCDNPLEKATIKPRGGRPRKAPGDLATKRATKRDMARQIIRSMTEAGEPVDIKNLHQEHPKISESTFAEAKELEEAWMEGRMEERAEVMIKSHAQPANSDQSEHEHVFVCQTCGASYDDDYHRA